VRAFFEPAALGAIIGQSDRLFDGFAAQSDRRRAPDHLEPRWKIGRYGPMELYVGNRILSAWARC
jgi:hypothetical protein